MLQPLKGQVRWAFLQQGRGSVQYGPRPVYIAGNNTGNKHSPVAIVIPMTSKKKKPMPTHVEIKAGNGLKLDSTILAEQILTIDKSDLGNVITQLPESEIQLVDSAVRVSMGL